MGNAKGLTREQLDKMIEGMRRRGELDPKWWLMS